MSYPAQVTRDYGINSAAAVWREVEGEIVVLAHDGRQYLAVNGSGTVLWRLLAEGSTREGLVAALVAEYGAEVADPAEDVDAFLGALRVRELLTESD